MRATRGADIQVRTSLEHARRDNGLWRATLAARDGATREVTARAIVNAAGPWVCDVLGAVSDAPVKAKVRHVKGSHIVVPRVHAEPHAYILQNADNRIVFIIPYQERYSLIGTTDVPVETYEHPAISDEETFYLLTLANTYLERPLASADIVWTYSGVRPLYDDGTTDPSAVTRDYVLRLDTARNGSRESRAPMLSVFGGKITTYRKLAEAALAELRPFFPQMKGEWTRDAILPGGDLPSGGMATWQEDLARRYPEMPAPLLRALAHRHGTRVHRGAGRCAQAWRSRRGLRRRPHRAGDRLSAQRGVGDRQRRHPVAAHQVRVVDERRPARTRRCVRRRVTPKPLASMPEHVRRKLRFVLTDIDDTLTTDGKLTAGAYRALERLHDAGRIVVPVTGRPAGWCDHIARMWPVDAVVGENGAFYMRFDATQRKLRPQRSWRRTPSVLRMRERLAAIGATILRAYQAAPSPPTSTTGKPISRSTTARTCAPSPRRAVAQIVALMQAEGMTAKVSSIHVNGWFGTYDKLAMTRVLFDEVFGERLEAVRDAVLFAGDSPNDAPMFAYFPCAVGVANLRRFLPQILTPPAYIATGEAGTGFTEIADLLLA